jgi:hypothetical protein
MNLKKQIPRFTRNDIVGHSIELVRVHSKLRHAKEKPERQIVAAPG